MDFGLAVFQVAGVFGGVRLWEEMTQRRIVKT